MDGHLRKTRGGKKGQIRPMLRFCVSFQRHGDNRNRKLCEVRPSLSFTIENTPAKHLSHLVGCEKPPPEERVQLIVGMIKKLRERRLVGCWIGTPKLNMLLTISYPGNPATDLGYLLHKSPFRVHSLEQAFGGRMFSTPRPRQPVVLRRSCWRLIRSDSCGTDVGRAAKRTL